MVVYPRYGPGEHLEGAQGPTRVDMVVTNVTVRQNETQVKG